MNKVQCPHCRTHLDDDGSLAGQPVSCPQCGGQFVVPGVAPPPAGMPIDTSWVPPPRQYRVGVGGKARKTGQHAFGASFGGPFGIVLGVFAALFLVGLLMIGGDQAPSARQVPAQATVGQKQRSYAEACEIYEDEMREMNRVEHQAAEKMAKLKRLHFSTLDKLMQMKNVQSEAARAGAPKIPHLAEDIEQARADFAKVENALAEASAQSGKDCALQEARFERALLAKDEAEKREFRAIPTP